MNHLLTPPVNTISLFMQRFFCSRKCVCMNADLFRKLSALGLSIEQIGGVLEVIEARDAEHAAVIEAGREKARERWHRWKNKKGTNVSKRLPTDTNVSQQLTRGEDSSSNLEISGQKEKDSLSSIEREFDETFWPVYPLKKGKREALKAFRAARKRASLETIMAGARRYAAERAGQDSQFTKQAQGWLNGDKWEDEPSPPPAPRQASPPPVSGFNAILDEIKGSGNASPSIEPPTLDASFERADRGGPTGSVQLYAFPSRR